MAQRSDSAQKQGKRPKEYNLSSSLSFLLIVKQFSLLCHFQHFIWITITLKIVMLRLVASRQAK